MEAPGISGRRCDGAGRAGNGIHCTLLFWMVLEKTLEVFWNQPLFLLTGLEVAISEPMLHWQLPCTGSSYGLVCFYCQPKGYKHTNSLVGSHVLRKTSSLCGPPNWFRDSFLPLLPKEAKETSDKTGHGMLCAGLYGLTVSVLEKTRKKRP
jgi:hypothetical protein